MKSVTAILMAGMLLGLGFAWRPVPAAAASIVATTDAAAVVTVSDLTVHGGAVSGLLTNNSQRLVRDVQLVIRHSWLWKNERHPGEDDPGRADVYAASNEIPPGGSVRFTYEGAPLPGRTDGHFETTVDVTGFTEVGD